jgi:hypothetical protein
MDRGEKCPKKKAPLKRRLYSLLIANLWEQGFPFRTVCTVEELFGEIFGCVIDVVSVIVIVFFAVIVFFLVGLP